jgi:glycosyltransferase involved in cell wall biosynthesis
VPEGFHAALQRMYGDRIPPTLGAAGNLDGGEADRYGLLMAREVIGRSTRFLTMSRFAAELARFDADPGDRPRIEVVPFGVRPPLPSDATTREERLVATFGVVNEIKQTSTLVQAMRHPSLDGARLAVVGPISDEERARLLALDDRVIITGAVTDEDYERWLRRATVAVQLRASTNGESSAAVADCLAAGLPTVVTRIGAARELPDDATVKVAPGIGPEALGAAIAALLADPARRAAMSGAAVAYAEAHGFDTAAAALLALITA